VPLVALASAPLAAQDTLTVADTLPGWAINLGIQRFGLSLGNSSRWNGIRVNLSDRAVREVNGLNLALWRPLRNRFAVYRGISLGVFPYGASFAGVTLGLGGVVAERSLSGLNLGGLGLVANRDLRGINVSGLGTVSQGAMYGVNLAGLGTVAQGDMVGLNLAGLGTVSQRRMRWVSLGGLATVAEGSIEGVSAGGLAVVTQGDLRGITGAGLAAVAQGRVEGLTVAGLAVVGEGSITGLTVTLGAVESAAAVRGLAMAGYRIKSPLVQGVVVPVAWLRAQRLDGLSVSVYNRVVNQQHGLTIGLVNYAKALHGFQLGVVNIAGNNRAIARVLPVLNLHL
jgi:hypothetical protein